VEPENGAVFIDDVNTKCISLDALRSNLTIIPQDPCMFSTTVRQNLDPFKNHTDEELWEALAKCQMKEVVKGLKGKLNFYVAERGENFSVGQRQLLCIARALIRKPKVLMLDEATASIDQESDTFIQKTIREAFGDITVITIAHRINTIIDSDKVLVMEEGKIAEYDSPKNLLNQKDSMFSKLINNMGEEAANHMRTLANANMVKIKM
jgi:ABC-type multidrug transport system fused ATPase/permease subunit